MTIIDKSKPVLVTGATGYVAGWLVKRLLDEGLTVHAAVRNPESKTKVAHLDALAANSKGEIKYFKSDLLNEGSYAEAMEGCELVFHTASPFFTNVKDPQKELIDPAVKGTSNVLKQANATSSVKRVVITSSCAAIYTDAIDCQMAPQGMINEQMWNTTASLKHQPYYLSKTLAEKKAWEICEAQEKWDLVAINPSLILGPTLNQNSGPSESMSLLKQVGDGSMKMGVPDIGVGVVDVRDVAEAHYLAGFTPEAIGRFITSGSNSSFLEIGKVLSSKYGNEYPLPTKPLPKWLLYLVGPMINKAMTYKFIKGNVNIAWAADNSKIKKELGLKFRPLKETLVDAFESLIEAGELKPK